MRDKFETQTSQKSSMDANKSNIDRRSHKPQLNYQILSFIISPNAIWKNMKPGNEIFQLMR